MPRRDGEVFFRGTAMALFSLNYFAGAGRRRMPVGSEAGLIKEAAQRG
jgi:hypothetical protein